MNRQCIEKRRVQALRWLGGDGVSSVRLQPDHEGTAQMLDRKSMEDTARAIREELDRQARERERLQEALDGIESWLGQEPMTTASPPPASGLTMRKAVLSIIHSSRKPMHANDILSKARAMGADTTAKKPTSIVGLILHKEKDVEKVGPATYVSRRAS